MGTGKDMIVIGGGVIGLSCAWKASLRGLSVTVVDPAPGRGASWAAAGMLAPASEAHYGEEALIGLNQASAGAWPAFAAELEASSGLPVGYLQCGTLTVALDQGDLALLESVGRFQQDLGLTSEILGPGPARELEPALAPGIRGGLLTSGDHQVDNRLLVEALIRAAQLAGASLLAGSVSEVTTSHERVSGVRLAGGTTLEAGTVLLAAGCWSAQVGVPEASRTPVRPVKGVILRLRGEPLLARNLRGFVAGSSAYLVPRADGSVVLGATVEEQGFDTGLSVRSVADLLRDARAILPAVEELELVEVMAGLRPGSPDNAPILGPSGLDGLVVATGHYRNGILLAPLTADSLVELIVEGVTPELIAPFSPQRWHRAAAPTGR